MSSEIAIKVNRLTKCYQIYDTPRERLKQFILPRFQRALGIRVQKYHRDFHALNEVSFEINKGETVGIIGRNGSGKSTLLQLICGTVNPTSGVIKTTGRIAALLELGSGFNPEFTGRENVYLNASVLGLGEEEINARINDIIDFADIGDFIDQPVRTYSSGMYVRLAFAVSASVAPDILVVDEALAVGDIGFQLKCIDRIMKLKSSGATIVIVAHDTGKIKSLCDRAIYLKRGELVSYGSPGDVIEEYLMEMRKSQISGDKVNTYITKKKSIGGNVLAFGTEEGEILDAKFISTQNHFAIFSHLEDIKFHISLILNKKINFPALSVIVRDSRMLDLGGEVFRIAEKYEIDHIINLEFSIRNIFMAGRYSILLRLESRIDQGTFIPIDKQSGALIFSIVDGCESKIGPCNLEIVRTA